MLAEDTAPAVVLVSASDAALRVLPLLRPQDELAFHDEPSALLEARLERLEARRKDAAELARRREHLDPLTGLPDRLRCLQWLEVDDNAWPHEDVARGLVHIDLDMFKDFNEAHGWNAGDAILRDAAQALRALAQPGDLVFRLELEEFVVILDRDSAEAVARDAEAMRRAIGAVSWPGTDGPVHVTASAGLAFLRSSGFRYIALQQADTAMYMAKILGRDNLVRHEDVRQLAAETGATLELSDLSAQAELAKARLVKMADSLQRKLLAQARLEADIDALTGLRNRRYFDSRVARQMDAARRDGRALAIVLFDIDDFGSFNKKHGHPTGDAVLRAVANVARCSVRGADWIARYGGEEFCLVMEAGAEEASRVAERIRTAVGDMRVDSLDGVPLGVTLSLGAVVFDPARDATPDLLLQRASRAALTAKAAGKNRVVVQ